MNDMIIKTFLKNNPNVINFLNDSLESSYSDLSLRYLQNTTLKNETNTTIINNTSITNNTTSQTNNTATNATIGPILAFCNIFIFNFNSKSYKARKSGYDVYAISHYCNNYSFHCLHSSE